MKLSTHAALTSAFFCSLLATSAHAQDEPAHEDAPPPAPAAPATTTTTTERPDAPRVRRPFGSDGSVVLDDLLGLGFATGALGLAPVGSLGIAQTGWLRFGETKSEGSNGSSRYTEIALAPSVDVFVSPHVSIGGQLQLFTQRARSTGQEQTSVGGGLRPRVGYVFAVTDDLALWVHAFGSVAVSHAVDQAIFAQDGTAYTPRSSVLAWSVGTDAVFVTPVARSVALTFGPSLSYGKIDMFAARESPYNSQPSGTAISFGARGGIAIVL